MTSPVSAAVGVSTLHRAIAATGPTAGPSGGAAAPSGLDGVARSFRDVLASVARSERVVDRAMARVAHGADLDEAELLAVQTAVYRASREAELVAKAVDRVADSVREITQMKV